MLEPSEWRKGYVRGEGKVRLNKAQSSEWSGQVAEEGELREEVHLPGVFGKDLRL